MSDLAVNILCRNPTEDRIIPRLGRYLRDSLGWMLTAEPVKGADAYYLSLYFEDGMLPKGHTKPVAAYFSHREVEPPGNPKSRWFDRVAAEVDLRIVTAAMYGRELAPYGRTVQIPAPVERDRFTIPARKPGRGGIVAGFSGYKYGNGRKGEDLARALLTLPSSQRLMWRASGRGWPVKTTRLLWSQMAAFYQSLDVLVVTSRVEGVPMPPLEALACGVSVVVPCGVGLLDELPDVEGIYRYPAGDKIGLARAFVAATAGRGEVNRDALRAVTEKYTVEAWCQGHKKAMEALVLGEKMDLSAVLVDEDGDIFAAVRDAYPDVDAVLNWTARHIPHKRQQIAPYQGAVLAYYAHHFNYPGAKILEIGTLQGYSACLMATAAPHAAVTTLNPKDGEHEQAAANLRIRSNVQVVKQTSQEFYRARRGELYDLIFVDGDHSYKVVLHDSQFFNSLRPGGLILFHDYSPDGSARPSDGCYRALNDLQEARRPADVRVIGTGNVGMLGWIRREGEVWAS